LKRAKELIGDIKRTLSLVAKGFASTATDAIEAELKEMENAFALVLVSSLSGMPSPPGYLGLRLLPYMEREVMVMLSRAQNLDDQFAQWFSILEFG